MGHFAYNSASPPKSYIRGKILVAKEVFFKTYIIIPRLLYFIAYIGVIKYFIVGAGPEAE